MRDISTPLALAPAQQRALDALLALPPGAAVLTTRRGMGRTAILRAAHAALGGRLLTAADLVRALDARHPLGIEDALYRLLADTLVEHPVVIVDDLHLVTAPLFMGHFYPRTRPRAAGAGSSPRAISGHSPASGRAPAACCSKSSRPTTSRTCCADIWATLRRGSTPRASTASRGA